MRGPRGVAVGMRRTNDEIALMRRAGRVVAEMHEAIRGAAQPGVTTAFLDSVGREVLHRRGATSNFLNYHGYPATICTSPNDVVVHGIPGPYVLREGDLLSIDCGAIVSGWHADAAFSMIVGSGPGPGVALELIRVTDRALWAAIERMGDGVALHELGRKVQDTAERAGFSVVRDYVGHGIGTAMHEAPSVPNFWPGSPGPRLHAGQVLAIEPMVNSGAAATRVLKDGWTVATADGGLSAHAEHTVALTEDGPEVLTLP